ncbi:hypothetical protein O1611_g1921 [Lasiodiplodia mahajangana]|uniref:Uncharacterized protein n=1 Tax=Lasiodiplodia mahajangana TaxID=1108764 RepID=A0ACC2JWJ2_9PEZI|nr:hypothetical protein O1611_g1921 [Lasiodiplodia mahajangana]
MSASSPVPAYLSNLLRVPERAKLEPADNRQIFDPDPSITNDKSEHDEPRRKRPRSHKTPSPQPEVISLLSSDEEDCVHVPEQVKKEIAARSGIGLELCLSCNVKAKMIVGSFDAHHFGEWWRVDGPVVVPCTDDVGVFGSPLSNEWALIQEHFHLGRKDILSLARKGIDVIFGGDEQKARLRDIMW